MKIVIDARELRTSTGRYVERLIFYLQRLDLNNDYVILLKPGDFDTWSHQTPVLLKLNVLTKNSLLANNWDCCGRYTG